MISRQILLKSFFKRDGAHFFSQLNGFTYLYLIRMILFTINHLFAQLNVFNYVSLTIQLNISHLFTHSQMIKRFYFKQFSLALVLSLDNSSI